LREVPRSACPPVPGFDPNCSVVTPTTAAMVRNAAVPMVPSFFFVGPGARIEDPGHPFGK
jgi:hypothetical protein